MGFVERELKNQSARQEEGIPAEHGPVAPQAPQSMPHQQFNVPVSEAPFVPSTEETGKRRSVVERQIRKEQQRETVQPRISSEEEVRRRAEINNEVLEVNALAQAKRAADKEKKRIRNRKITYTLMIIACIYLIFLIYGVCCTYYAYNDKGEVEPVVLNVAELREKKRFDVLKVQYENLRTLYEKVLILDYRLAQGVENPLTIAPEYEALLDEVNDLTVKTDALDVETKYDAIKRMMLVWVKEDIAYYLQFVSKAISENSSSAQADAEKYRLISEQAFQTITANIVTIGDTVAGSDMTNIKNWSPEKLYQEYFSEGR